LDEGGPARKGRGQGQSLSRGSKAHHHQKKTRRGDVPARFCAVIVDNRDGGQRNATPIGDGKKGSGEKHRKNLNLTKNRA